jgi:thioredoxin-like negative regulator of GroEL
VGRYDKVVEIWEGRVKEDPENSQFRLSLAAAYVGNGQRQKAIKEIKGLMEELPDFQEQGQYYINEIRAGRNP